MFLPQKFSKIRSKQDMVVGTRETGTEKATKPVESHPIPQGDLFIPGPQKGCHPMDLFSWDFPMKIMGFSHENF